jgi:5-methylcytosine-specific restriction endonuclease McrA
MRAAIWRANNKRCFYCQEPIQFCNLEIDHLIPKATSGDRVQQLVDYNVPMNQDTIFEILSEPDIIKDRKLSGKKVHIKWGEGNLQPNSKRKSCWRFSKKKNRSANLQPSMG